MTSPALGDGNGIYLISLTATHLEFSELEVISKRGKVGIFWNVQV